MNNKLHRLVLMGMGSFAIVVLSVFAASGMRGSSAPAGDDVAQSTPNPRPPNLPVSAVRG